MGPRNRATVETALITGAWSGIGAALARRFARAGFNLVLVARSADKLKALATALSDTFGVETRVVSADLAHPEAAKKLATSMKRARRSIDVLVNNAGVLEHGPFVKMHAARHRELIDLNVAGVTAMLAHFLPPMVSRRRGRVLNVASIAAFQPVPLLATYAATKAYVLSLTESLSEELKGTGVSVTALCPGITDTHMLAAARRTSKELAKLPGFVVGAAEAVADEGFDACLRGKVICVPGALNHAAALAAGATPKWLLRRVSGALARSIK
jgi:short-subunit dehydrogenase